MSRRGIYLPSRRYFAWSAVAIVAIMTLALVAWAMTAGMATRGPVTAVAGMVGVASCAAIVGAIDALKRIEASGWSFEEPRWSRWVVFYAVWALVGLGIGIGRAVVLQMGYGLTFAPGRLAFEMLICLYMAVLLAFTLENQTMFLRVAARKQESSRSAVRFLFETREAFVRASELRRHEALSVLEHQVEPELRAIQEGVARMRAGRLAEHEVAAMLEKLDHLRDTEIRQVSHLLHPSIIDLGLVPALRALARNRDDATPIRLEADPAAVEGLSPEGSLQLYRIVEDALELARKQAAREVRISLAPAEGKRLLLAITVCGSGIDLAQAREIGEQTLLDARVALLRGERRLEREGEDRIVIRIACPVEGAESDR
jgi:glucose-6-phosphate-specific signal transduction histidine kinase